jgi:hypothetical protein
MSDNDNRFSGIEFSDDLTVVPVVVAPEDPIRQIEIEDPTPTVTEPTRNFVIPRMPDAPSLAPSTPVARPRTQVDVNATEISVDASAPESMISGARIYVYEFRDVSVEDLTLRLAGMDLGFPRVASATEALGIAMKGVKHKLSDGNVIKGYHREKRRGSWSLLRYRDNNDETPVSGDEWAGIRILDGAIETKVHNVEISSVVAGIVEKATTMTGTTVTDAALRQWVQRVLDTHCGGITLCKNEGFVWVPASCIPLMRQLSAALQGIAIVDVMETANTATLQRQATEGLAREVDTVLAEIRNAVQGHSVGEEITERKARGITGRADALCQRLETMGRLFPSALNGVKAIREAVKAMDSLVGYSRASGLDV